MALLANMEYRQDQSDEYKALRLGLLRKCYYRLYRHYCFPQVYCKKESRRLSKCIEGIWFCGRILIIGFQALQHRADLLYSRSSSPEYSIYS